MSDTAAPPPDPARDADAELAKTQRKVEAARVLLMRLLQDVVVAESRLRRSEAAQMLEANEQLVLTAMRQQTEAESAARLLAKLSRSAELDPLTQLPNRALMLDRCNQAIATAKRHERRLALLFLDLNGFKQVNDSLGHASGDEILKIMSHRLVAAVRDTDTVSRHGGDEFVVLLTEVTQASDAGRIAEALLLALAAPSRIGSQVMRLTASIGIAIYPEDGDSVQLLLERADAAMYQAKRQGLGCMAFHDTRTKRAAVLPHAGSDATPVPALRGPLSDHASAVEDQQLRHAALREANERLLLAALSAQDLLAAAERAQQRQAEFMALIARELANPAAPIRMAAAMLGPEGAAEPLLPMAQSIVAKQVDHMAHLLAAVQAVAQAEQFAHSLERRTVDLCAVVDAAVAAGRPAMDARLQTFTVQLPAEPVLVLGEPVRLEQLLSNLLDNASQYTPDLGHIQLALQVSGELAELRVTDSGIGITALALPTIFEPFSQDVPALGLRAVGLGIGLAVVRALAEAHGGTVRASSAGTGRGSEFTLCLPLAGSAP